MRLTVRSDIGLTLAETRIARREINVRAKRAVALAAEHVGLPAIRGLAPHVVKEHFAARALGIRAYVTTTGPIKYDRIAGLLNWGGTVSTPIQPKSKKALTTPWGARAVVWRGADGHSGHPAHYTGKRYIERAIDATGDDLEVEMTREITHAFDGLLHD